MKFNFKKLIDSQISKKISDYILENTASSYLELSRVNYKNKISYASFHQNISNILNDKLILKSDDKTSITKNDEIIDYSMLTVEENNNCLALTIKKDYKLTSLVNVAIRSCRMTFKVLVSYFALNIIKLFF